MSSTDEKNEFTSLPEDCVASITGFTTPGDACRVAAVSKMCRSAAESDPVWERFLPPDYRRIIAQSDEGDSLLLTNNLSKKKLYHRLADQPLLIDSSTKSFWLEKSSGKKCYMISARSITIIWSDTPRYWNWISIPESRFPDVAELLIVFWLEIRGKVNTSLLSPRTNYEAYLVYKLTQKSRGLDGHTVASVAINGVEIGTRNVLFEPKNYHQQRRQIEGETKNLRMFNQPKMTHDDRYPNYREDGWLEIKIGSFFNDNGEDEVELSILEIKELNGKSGLIVEGIELRPLVIRHAEMSQGEASCSRVH